MLRDKYISLIAKSNGEDALKQVIFKAAAKAYLPHAPAPVERREADGRAEQKVRLSRFVFPFAHDPRTACLTQVQLKKHFQ